MGPRYYRVEDGDATQPIVVPAPAQVPTLTQPLTWKAVSLTLAMAALTALSGIAGSHIGAPTKDDLAKAIAPLATKEDVQTWLKAAIAKESDDMKQYVDGKAEQGRQQPVKPARRKQRQPEEARE